jgi:hypothetical protein
MASVLLDYTLISILPNSMGLMIHLFRWGSALNGTRSGSRSRPNRVFEFVADAYRGVVISVK